MVNGSHFLGGTITWHLQDTSAIGTPVALVITQTYSWTYTSAVCTNAMIATNQPVPGTGGTLICLPTCPSGFGAVSATPICTDISPLNGITVGQRLDTVYVPAGSNFSVAFRGSAWGSLSTGGTTWSIVSNINLVLRSDNGKYNSAPVSTMMSPINIQVNETTVITVPVSDADGDIIRCRWATSSNGIDECASVCPPSSLPANTTIYPDCTIVITGYNVSDKFAVTLMVEDFINSTSTTPLSSVPVQFLVKVIAPVSCLYRPEVILLAESCTPLKVNQTFTSTLLAINKCGGSVSIVDIATLSFSGMIKSALVMSNSTLYYKNLTWTPTINQLGYQVMCAMALDSENAQSLQYCFTFYVTENGGNTCPGVVYNTTTTLIILTTTLETFKPDSGGVNNWPWIGSLIGVAFLIALTVSCCLVWHYCNPFAGSRRRKWYKSDKTIKIADNESCVDSIPTVRSSAKMLSAAPQTNLTHTISDEKTKKLIVHQTLAPNQKGNDLSSPISSIKHSSRKIDHDVRGTATSCTPVLKCKKFETMSNAGDVNVQPIRLIRKQEQNDRICRMKLKNKRRSSSFSGQLFQKRTLARRSSANDIDLLRVTHVRSHPTEAKTLPFDDIRPSTIENTIQLDDINRNTHSVRRNKDKVQIFQKRTLARRSSANDIDLLRVTHVRSHPTTAKTLPFDDIRPSTIENTIQLDDINRNTHSVRRNKDKVHVSVVSSCVRPTASANNETAQSPNVVRVDYIKTAKKKSKITTITAPLKSVAEEPKNVTIDYIPREKRRN